MMFTEELRRYRNLLTERYGEAGSVAARNLEEWLTGDIPLAPKDTIVRLLRDDTLDLVFDSFWQMLPFGTGGRRGPVGYGPNRINPSVVAMTVQGHCDFLKGRFGERSPSVVVANDVRVFHDIVKTYRFLGPSHPLLGVSSRSLAVLACEIYAANGIRAFIASPQDSAAVMTTPMLSFGLRSLGAAGGVNLSASHNPPDDNGIKVYDGTGAQPIPPHDQELADRMEAARHVLRMPFEEACRAKLVVPFPDELVERYFALYLDLQPRTEERDSRALITYTPLCGSGLTTAGALLERLSFQVVTPPDQGPSGLFESIPFYVPNPEVPEATQPAQTFADSNGSSVVLSTDPDADRVGLDVRLQDGRWYHFDGNQIAAVLTYYLMLDPKGPQRRGLLIETLVTTRLLREIARRSNGSPVVDDLLVGFKYIADVLESLNKKGRYKDVAGRPGDLVIAAEESHGILVTPDIRDKDAAGACALLAQLHARLQHEGRTLFDYYAAILSEVGQYDCVNRSIMLRGADGVEKRDRLMESLRTSPPSELASAPVVEVIDYWDTARFGKFASETDRMSRNLVLFRTRSFQIVVRPSGTEPKIKVYCEVFPSQPLIAEQGERLVRALRQRAGDLARNVYAALLPRIGVSLNEPGLALPDIMGLEHKIFFEQQVLTNLREALASGTFSDVEAAKAWLRDQAVKQKMITGEPLPALREAVALALSGWSMKNSPVAGALGAWAQGGGAN